MNITFNPNASTVDRDIELLWHTSCSDKCIDKRDPADGDRIRTPPEGMHMQRAVMERIGPRLSVGLGGILALGTGLLRGVGSTFGGWKWVVNDQEAVCPLQITTESLESGMTLLRLAGKLEMHTVPAFRQTLQAEMQRSARGLILSLAEVPFVDSAGIAVLVEGLKWSRERAVPYILSHLTPDMHMMIELACLEKLFTIYHATSCDTQQPP
jgi:anti-anti-sigma factor